MKVLFLTSKSADYLSCVIWDGLQELLGEENVVDAVGAPYLHKSMADFGEKSNLGTCIIESSIGATREGRILQGFENQFDLLVVNASFAREYDWDFARRCAEKLKTHGKIAYVEGWDGAGQIFPPEMNVDAVFRKEIARGQPYPYQPNHLTFAAPARWLNYVEGLRPIDVFFSGNPEACLPGQEVRWPMLGNVFRTRRKHRSIVTTFGLGYEHYFSLLRQTKIGLCPSGADLTDSLRTFEVVASGAVPVFVGYPDHIRDPWFGGDMSFACTADTLPEHIDEALSQDLTEKRRALLEHVRKQHTTRARAEKLLEVVFA